MASGFNIYTFASIIVALAFIWKFTEDRDCVISFSQLSCGRSATKTLEKLNFLEDELKSLKKLKMFSDEVIPDVSVESMLLSAIADSEGKITPSNAVETVVSQFKAQIKEINDKLYDRKPNAALLGRREELEKLVIELHDYVPSRHFLHSIINDRQTRLPVGTIIAYHGPDLTSLPAWGWARCNGQSPAAQGIEGSILTATPNLSDGRYLKGTVEASADQQLFRYGDANTLIFSSSAGNDYTHSPVVVPLDGSFAADNGQRPFGGKWEQLGTKLGIQWKAPDPEPKNLEVTFIILCR
jgi:hypothetical protein